MLRPCPHCKTKMEVFDEECPACGKPSKPSAMLTFAAVIHGHRKLILLAAILILSWMILTWLFKW